MAIQLMVDSASDYEVQELKEKNLVCVPLTITFGEESFKDCFEITKEDFYNRLLEKKEYPKTSQPSTEEFLTYFKEAKKNNDSVIASQVMNKIAYLNNLSRVKTNCRLV